VNFSVPFGSIHMLPLADTARATLKLNCETAFTIGGQQDAEFGEGQLQGGALGIIIDARGRPMSSSSDASLRAGRVANWLSDLGVGA
jgi:hypothetical protein